MTQSVRRYKLLSLVRVQLGPTDLGTAIKVCHQHVLDKARKRRRVFGAVAWCSPNCDTSAALLHGIDTNSWQTLP